MATWQKEVVKFQQADWNTHNYAMRTNTERQEAASHEIRQEARSLRLSADLQNRWDAYTNTKRLGKRLEDVRSWRDKLDFTLEQLNDEIQMLNIAKDCLEERIAGLNKPSQTIVRLRTLRDGRKHIDNVFDKPEKELDKYKDLLIRSTNRYQLRIDEAFNQLNRLKQIRQQVLVDLQDKNVTMDIDLEQYKLKAQDAGVSYKPNCTRIPKGTVTLEEWFAFSHHNWVQARTEMTASQQLRDCIHFTICQVENDLEAQAELTRFVLRKRIHEYQMTLSELNWQKKTLEEEIAEMENDLNKVEKTILDTIPVTKVAQTRLERRTYRPGMDLCYDDPQDGLIGEVHQLDATTRALLEKQAQCRHSLDALNRQLNRVIDDIALKTESNNFDTECLNTLHGVTPIYKKGTVDPHSKDLVQGKEPNEGAIPDQIGKSLDHILA